MGAISFKALDSRVIAAVSDETSGQMNNRYCTQMSDMKYRLLSDYEKDVIRAISKKALENDRFDVFMGTDVDGFGKHLNRYGARLVIADRKKQTIVRTYEDVISRNLTIAQIINNVKHVVDDAQEMANRNTIFKKLRNFLINSRKDIEMCPYRDYLYENTFQTYSLYGGGKYEKIPPLKPADVLDVSGLDIQTTQKAKQAYEEMLIGQKDFGHNVIQRHYVSADKFKEINDFLKEAAPEMERENTFTQAVYDNLTESQKEKLREFSHKDITLQTRDFETHINIAKDAEKINLYADFIKENLDKKYGEGGYVIKGIGNSPAAFLTILKEKGVDAQTIPFSRGVLHNIGWDVYTTKDTTEKIDWEKYFEAFGLTKKSADELKAQNKKLIILDYTDTGSTKDILKTLISRFDLSIYRPDYVFEELEDLCKTRDSKRDERFVLEYIECKKGKLYSTCPNAGDTFGFYKNTEKIKGLFKWHPLTKLLFFNIHDKGGLLTEALKKAK